MGTYRLPAYIVLEIPPPISGDIQKIRDSLATPAALLPIEITVAGSSGIGPIVPGTGKSETEAMVKSVLSGFKPFHVRFQEIRRFPNTDIFYLAPQDRRSFDRLHEALKTSGIKFGRSPFPYNPHCTLRGGPMNGSASAEELFKIPIPIDDFVIDTLSIYEFDPSVVASHLSFRTRL